MKHRIVFVSSPASRLGDGGGGRVETTLFQLAPALANRVHKLGLIAPEGSAEPHGAVVYQIPGQLPETSHGLCAISRLLPPAAACWKDMWDCSHNVYNE